VVGVDAVRNEVKVRYMLRSNLANPATTRGYGMLYVTDAGEPTLCCASIRRVEKL